jgi:hypothetical protein
MKPNKRKKTSTVVVNCGAHTFRFEVSFADLFDEFVLQPKIKELKEYGKKHPELQKRIDSLLKRK